MKHMYRVNPANVVHDVFEDGEAAIIDLRTGTYYSLNTSGATLWPHLVDGTTVDALVAAVSATGALADEIATFVVGLFAEGLIEELSTDAALKANEATVTPITEAPSFERFDDLQELLLLDPIHDVGDAGWPQKAS